MRIATGARDTHGVYIHVPFCAARCGYCDFNTYTPRELAAHDLEVRPGGTQPGGGTGVGLASPRPAAGNTTAGYLDALERELDMAAAAWDRTGMAAGGVHTVFFGGGTPSMLGAEGLTRALGAVRRTLGLAADAEVTTEANPESTNPAFFDELRAGGFTRVSLGMQSASPGVLRVLDRRHTPGRPVAAVAEALGAGFEHVNVDLIYGTPSETDEDLRASLDAALGSGADHVSAYSLIVEDGTALARRVRRGELPAPDEDVLAERYRIIDGALRGAGMHWYEVSNWARPGGECRHNLLYWRSGQWWGAGPGAHGCVQLSAQGIAELARAGARAERPVRSESAGAGPTGQETSRPPEVDSVPRGTDPAPRLTRLVNVKHPSHYYGALCAPAGEASTLPVATSEALSPADVATERIMLGLRLREGIAAEDVADVESTIDQLVRRGLLRREGGRVAVTGSARYLADGIVTDILLAKDAAGQAVL